MKSIAFPMFPIVTAFLSLAISFVAALLIAAQPIDLLWHVMYYSDVGDYFEYFYRRFVPRTCTVWFGLLLVLHLVGVFVEPCIRAECHPIYLNGQLVVYLLFLGRLLLLYR